MRIGLTIRTFYPQSGGMQSHAESLIRKLEKAGHEVVIATRSVSHTPSFQDFFFFSESVSQEKINGLLVNVLRHSSSLNWLMWLVSKCIGRPATRQIGVKIVQMIFTPQLLDIFDRDMRHPVDIIHHVGQAHELIGFAAAAAARRLNIPFVIQPTAHPGQWGDSSFDVSLYQQADRLLVHTEYEGNALKALGLNGCYDTVGNGIEDCVEGDAQKFKDRYDLSDRIVLFLGRKTKDKGYDIVKQAMTYVHRQAPDVVLVCMGPDGTDPPSDLSSKPSLGQVCKDILELGFGTKNDKHDALAACDLLCVPSEGESFGLVYMEAGRYATPSIARRLPVLEELLEREDAIVLAGKAYGEGNKVNLTPEELGSSILALLNDCERRERIGLRAQQVSEQFTWDTVVTNFEAAYRAAILNYRDAHAVARKAC